MEGIPPARESDNEDVIWALETAESLWKRNARVDAIVWLRRAAQEAAEAGDDDRASSLMVEAATLTETMARHSSQARGGAPATMPPPEGYSSADKEARSVPPTDAGDIDALLDAGAAEPGRGEILESEVDSLDDAEALDDSDMIVSLVPVAPTPVPTGDPSTHDLGLHLAPLPAPPVIGSPPSDAADVASEPDPFAPEGRAIPETSRVTAPPPLEVSAGEASDLDAMLGEPSATEAHDEPESLPSPDAPAAEIIPASLPAADLPVLEGITRMSADALSPMDLAGLEPLATLTDLDREQLVRAATVLLCAADARIPDFGMAVLLEGEIVATTGNGEAIVAHFGPGSLVRTVGTLGSTVATRFTAAADDTTLALWDEAKVTSAFTSDAAVSGKLHAEADRLHAWTSLTTSPTGAKLPEEVRLRLSERLTVRALLGGAELIAANEVVGGIFLVGAGAIVIEGSTRGPLGPGEFVFPGATLSAGRATSSATAEEGGAVVLCADRRTTQELYATEPLLLELLAASS